MTARATFILILCVAVVFVVSNVEGQSDISSTKHNLSVTGPGTRPESVFFVILRTTLHLIHLFGTKSLSRRYTMFTRARHSRRVRSHNLQAQPNSV